MADFTLRNLVLFFRDKAAVILSFLAEFIIVVLYIFFMRDNLIEKFIAVEDAPVLLDTWMMAGIIGITSVSATMGVYGIMVEDREHNNYWDFNITPVNRYSLMGGYLAGASAVGMMMSLVMVLAAEIYIWCRCSILIDGIIQLKLMGVLVINTISNSMLAMLITSFVKSNNALASCCTIVGTLIGFMTGIYIPVGDLPTGIQTTVKFFPVSQGVVLVRQLLTEPLIMQSFGSERDSAAQEFMEQMGIFFMWEGQRIPDSISIIIMAVTALICFIAVNVRIAKR